jgi:hypothetical protein
VVIFAESFYGVGIISPAGFSFQTDFSETHFIDSAVKADLAKIGDFGIDKILS